MSPAISPLVPYESRSVLDRSVWYLGSLVTILARSEDTGGNFGLFEMLTRPGAEPATHVHAHEDELLFVKEGDVDCILGGRLTTLSRAGSVYLPRGIPHGFKVRSPEARFLVLVTPGGYEGIFRELGVPAEALTLPPAVAKPNARQLAETVARYGVRFVKRLSEAGPRLGAASQAAPSTSPDRACSGAGPCPAADFQSQAGRAPAAG